MTKTRKALVVAAALLAVWALTTGQGSFTDDPTDITSTISAGGSPPDTIRTGAAECFAANSVVFAISATTGMDSSIVLQVSQDNSHFFLVSQDGAINGAALLVGYLGGDSLRNGPHTAVAYFYGTPNSDVTDDALPFPYRYARLRLWKKTGTTITGLRVTATAIYEGGGQGDKSAYGGKPW